jgi:hypothetical protein
LDTRVGLSIPHKSEVAKQKMMRCTPGPKNEQVYRIPDMLSSNKHQDIINAASTQALLVVSSVHLIIFCLLPGSARQPAGFLPAPLKTFLNLTGKILR